MLGGQVVDVLNEGKKIDARTLDYIHKNKTAAMIIVFKSRSCSWWRK